MVQGVHGVCVCVWCVRVCGVCVQLGRVMVVERETVGRCI